MARVHYGFSDYHGTYAFAEPPASSNDDSARGQWYGIEASVVRPLGARHLVTAGVEFQDNFSQRQLNFDVEPRIVHQDSRNESERLALFGQDEITLSKRLTLHVGLRQDWYESFGYQTSPRLGLIYDDGQATTLKLLHGRAFRAPNEFELHYAGPVYKTNPDLGPETIRTTELVLERTLRRGLHLNASAYVNRDRQPDRAGAGPGGRPPRSTRTRARATRSARRSASSVKRRRGPSGRLSYAWQRSREQRDGRAAHELPAPHGQGGARLAAARQAPHRQRRRLVPERPAHAGRGGGRLLDGGAT